MVRSVNAGIRSTTMALRSNLPIGRCCKKRAHIDVFCDHLADADLLVKRLLPYDIVCVMRERTPLRREIIERLPNLKLIASTAPRNASIDMSAAAERGVRCATPVIFPVRRSN